MKLRIIQLCLILVLILPLAGAVGADPLYPYSEEEYRAHEQAFIAPLNPAYLNYISGSSSAEFSRTGTETRALGFVPATIDLSQNKGKQVTVSGSGTTLGTVTASSPVYGSGTVSAGGLAGSFDLRNQGKVTPVRDQEQCGCCWAFSTFGSLESTLLPGESWDFSENNMKGGSGYDLGGCGGGNNVISTAYLSRWSGAVAEADDPYNPSSSASRSATVRKHVQEVLYLPARDGPADNTNIKTALMSQGAVYSTVHWEDYYFRPTSASYYYPGGRDANHAVLIVGWDDHYDRRSFSPAAPGDGAYLVKNSWGTDWGDEGYLYVSYYDTVIGLDNAVFTAEPADNFDHNYQYDTLGWTESAGLGGQNAYFANVFTAQGQEQISAVSFYTPVVDSSYRISVYTDPFNGPTSSSGARTTAQGIIAIPGYHTIRLDEAVPLSAGQRFSVVVELATPGTRFPIAIESPIRGYSGRAVAQSGQSFVSSDGTEWTDLTKLYTGSNVCLKVFTDDAVQVVKVTPTITAQPTWAPTAMATPVPTVTATPIATPTPVITVMPIVYPTFEIPSYDYSLLEPVQNYSAFLFVYGAPTTPLSYIDDIGTLLPATSEFITGFISSSQVPPVVTGTLPADLPVNPDERLGFPGNETEMRPNPDNTSAPAGMTDPVLSGSRDPVPLPGQHTTRVSEGDSGGENTVKEVIQSSQESYPSPQERDSGGDVGTMENTSGNLPGFGAVNSTMTQGERNLPAVISPENIYLMVPDTTDLIPFPFMVSSPALVRISR
jgi:C1A family cysteine protease